MPFSRCGSNYHAVELLLLLLLLLLLSLDYLRRFPVLFEAVHSVRWKEAP
jgi:hypothetical protein